MTGFEGEIGAFREQLEAAGLRKFADSLVVVARIVRLVAVRASQRSEPPASQPAGSLAGGIGTNRLVDSAGEQGRLWFPRPTMPSLRVPRF